MSEWYHDSFGEDYLVVYRHRNGKNAEKEVRAMSGWMTLSAGASVLDLGCGMGRHAKALSELGYDVTGLDLSSVLLEEGRRGDRESRIRWVQGDMRKLPFADGSFDAVVNWFTSFGYFDDMADNAVVMAEISRVLKPGGAFLIDFLNAAYVKDHLVPLSERVDEPTGLRIVERRSIENDFVVKRIEVTPALANGGQARLYTERVRLLGLGQFRELAEQAGLDIEQTRGDYGGEPYEEAKSCRLIILGRRKG